MEIETKRSIFVCGVVFGFVYIVLSIFTKEPLVVLGAYIISFVAILFVVGTVNYPVSDKIRGLLVTTDSVRV